MKRLVALVLLAVVFSRLSPLALAEYTLEKPSAGQVIFTEADNALDYRADFPLSALTGAFRDGDDLRLEFPAARLTLKGFFAPLGEWRRIEFSDGGSLGGVDFNENGQCTAQFHSVLIQKKSSQTDKKGTDTGELSSVPVQVWLSPYGNRAAVNGVDVFGESLNSCIAAVGSIFPADSPDWSIYRELMFELTMDADGKLSPERSYIEFINGVSAVTLNPQRVCPIACFRLAPLSVGRATVSFFNAQGDILTELQLRCYEDENGEVALSSECALCGENQAGELHYMLCGHSRCAEGFDESAHAVPQCNVAGHCISENEHEKCSNCLSFTCLGDGHGIGYCNHEHNWVAISLNSSRCASCGYVYTNK